MQALLTAARQRGDDLIIPAAVLAELYRGALVPSVDAGLNRHPAWTIAPTTRPLARLVGQLLTAASRGSADHVDACVIATAIAAGGGNVITGDPEDMSHIAAGNPAISVIALGA